MKKMKKLKGIPSLLMALVMFLWMVPMPAYAADPEGLIGQQQAGITEETESAKPTETPKTVTVAAQTSAVAADEECPHEKTYVKESGDSAFHYLICTNCRQIVDKGPHDFGADGKCSCGAQEPEPVHVHTWVKGTCSSCGAQHTEHTWKIQGWSIDGSSHPVVCTVCGAQDSQPCTLEETQSPSYGHVYLCACGYFIPAEDVHHWGKWESDGHGGHTAQCTDAGCTAARTEDCRLEAFVDHDHNVAGVKCSVCGWIKYDDGVIGGDDNKCEHKTLGTIGSYSGDGYSHYVNCLDCGKPVLQRCELDLLTIGGKPVAHYCTVCGHQVPIEGSDYCTDTADGHAYGPKAEVLSEDGKSVLTTMTCTKCGYVYISDICNSPAHVVVHYVDEQGKQIAPDQTQAVIRGMEYSIPSPPVEGYTPDEAAISGKSVDGKGAEFTVTYRRTYTLTIEYRYNFADGSSGTFSIHRQTLKNGGEYAVKSPDKTDDGYALAAPNQQTVSGKIDGRDVIEHVDYKAIEYKWVIRYQYEDGKQAREPMVQYFTVENIKSLAAVKTEPIPGYTADKEVVAAPTALGDVTVTVLYKTPTSPDPVDPDDPEPAPTYTVTYTDGVEGEVVFADQVRSGLSAGSETPAFEGGTPSREGYVFTGWSPSVAQTVTENAVYTATWAETEAPDEDPEEDPDENPVEPEPTPTPTPTPAPVTPEPAPAPAPVPAPAPAPAPAAETTPEDEEMADDPAPLAAPAEAIPEDEELEDAAVPLAAVPPAGGQGGAWALLNFALMNLAVFEALALLIGYFRNPKGAEDEERKLRKKGIVRILSVPVAVLSVLAFCLTEDITLPTAFVDKYTLLMAAIAIGQTVLAALSGKKAEKEEA